MSSGDQGELGGGVLPPPNMLIALDLPTECVPGVRANLELLRVHLDNLEGFAIPGAEPR
jgi:hypothetical protein